MVHGSRHYMVGIGRMGISTFSYESSRLGIEILARGGNALDAFIAAQLAMEAYEPGWTGLGGGGFTLIDDGSGPHFLDYRETAPTRILEAVEPDQVLMEGVHSIAVPGMGRGLEELHRRYGSIPLSRIIETVVETLERGVKATPLLYGSLRTYRRDLDKLARHGGRELGIGSEPPSICSPIQVSRYIETLRRVMREGLESLYTGSLARELVAELESLGGVITLEDLESYRPVWRSPHRATIHGYSIATSPPPGSGYSVARLLGEMVETGDDPAVKPNILVEIHRERELIEDPDIGLGYPHETAQFTIYDGEMIVSSTTTIECVMGSGVVSKSLGVILNDELHDFSTSGDRNRLRPRARPRSSMSPTIVYQGSTPILALGSSGGTRIVTAVAQTLYNRLFRGLDLPSSVEWRRIHYEARRDAFLYEPSRYTEEAVEAAREMGKPIVNASIRYPSPYRKGLSLQMGDVEAVEIDPPHNLFVSDPRKGMGALSIG